MSSGPLVRSSGFSLLRAWDSLKGEIQTNEFVGVLFFWLRLGCARFIRAHRGFWLQPIETRVFSVPMHAKPGEQAAEKEYNVFAGSNTMTFLKTQTGKTARMREKRSDGVTQTVRPGLKVVALAASAGGLSALSQVLSGLPANFPAALVVVQHLDPRHRSMMAHILGRRTALDVREAAEGDRLCPGTVFVAPPDKHLLVNTDGTLSLTQSELVHFVRPSADLLLESAAASYKEDAIAVILTGTGSDGTMGVQAIRKMGGTVIAQDEQSSEFFGMPGAAIQTGSVDLILPLTEIPEAVMTLVTKEGIPP